ncbi:SRPBCC family protein [Tsuneonella mangrovi]|uniref:SRPBCC family protein n=1 Tax=Tsuneonella mangrovi TaxID=1982042 RepID=UPI001F0A559B|nr:SRPBCC family protein [Tsuneonella mangrovi]
MIRTTMNRALLGSLATLAAAAAPPTSAKVIKSEANMFVTRDSATVKAAPLETWLMLIKPAEWWNSAHTWSGDAANLTITPQGGGCFCERIPEEPTANSAGLAGSAQHMTVVLAEPLKALRMRGALGPLQSEPVTGVLTITLQPTDTGGTKIVWEYVVGGQMRYPVDVISKAVDGVMSEQLDGLAAKLGRVDAPKPPPEPEAAPAAAPDDKPDAQEPSGPTDVGAALDAMAAKKQPESDTQSQGR